MLYRNLFPITALLAPVSSLKGYAAILCVLLAYASDSGAQSSVPAGGPPGSQAGFSAPSVPTSEAGKEQDVAQEGPANADPNPKPQMFKPGKKRGKTHRVTRDGAELVFEDVDGVAVLEGDVVLGTTAEMLGSSSQVQGRGLKANVSSSVQRWPNGVVPYRFASGTDSAAKTAAVDAMRDIESKLNVYATSRGFSLSFRPATSADIDLIEITSVADAGCWSRLGRVGGVQELSLAPGCQSRGIATHELMHAIGIKHEQSRCDRDTYIRVNTANIQDEHLSQFSRHCSGFTDLGNYDYCSIMHYPWSAFSKNGLATINALQSYSCIVEGQSVRMGQRAGLSSGDIYAIDNALRDTVLVSYTSLPSATTINSGWYFARQEQGGKYLDVSGSCWGQNSCVLQLWDIGQTPDNNSFYFQRQGTSLDYRIINRDRHVEIDWWNSSTNGQRAWVYNWSVTDNQLWRLHRVAKDRYVLRNKQTGKVLAPTSSCLGTNGCAVGQWNVSAGNLSQVWVLYGPY